MTEPPSDPGIRAREQDDAVARAGWRVFAVLVGWAALALVRPDAPAAALLTDAAAAGAGWWALGPALASGSPTFGQPASWTRFLFLPPLLATAMTVRDVWRIVRGG